jgi:hypothetical protein
VVLVLVRGATRRALGEMEVESRTAGAAWQTSAAESAQVGLCLNQLDESETGRDAADRLVAWLVDRGV